MIARLTGTVAEIAPDHLVLDVQGVGYEVFVTTRTAETARPETALTLHVHTQLREDSLTLFGFTTAAEKASTWSRSPPKFARHSACNRLAGARVGARARSPRVCRAAPTPRVRTRGS